MSNYVKFLVTVVIFITFPAIHVYAAKSTVNVNCAKKDSINDALTSTAQELTIQISGICLEDVEITRDNVTLRGTDPNSDGIQGVSTLNLPGDGVVRVRGGRNVSFENLKITGGIRNGLVADGDNLVTVTNCRIINNARFQVVSSGNLSATDTEMSGGLAGIAALCCILQCTRCTVTDVIFGLQVTEGGFLNFVDSTLTLSGTDSVAAYADSAGFYGIMNSTLSAAYSLDLENEGQAVARNSTLQGFFFLFQKGSARLINTVQVLPVAEVSDEPANSIALDSIVELRSGSNMVGDTFVGPFSGYVQDNGSLDGNLFCAPASDAYCADPASVSGTVSNCENCVQSESISEFSAPLSLSKKTAEPPESRRRMEILEP